MENYETIDNFNPNFQSVEHPEAGTIQTLGIVGLVLTFLIGIVGVVINIVNVVKASRVRAEIDSNPGKYTEDSVKKINSGRICSIVGLSLQGGAVLIILIAAVSGMF